MTPTGMFKFDELADVACLVDGSRMRTNEMRSTKSPSTRRKGQISSRIYFIGWDEAQVRLFSASPQRGIRQLPIRQHHNRIVKTSSQ